MNGDSRCSNVFESIAAICDDFERDWSLGQCPRIEDYLSHAAAHVQPDLLRVLLISEVRLCAEHNQSIDEETYIKRFARWPNVVADVFASRRQELASGAETSAGAFDTRSSGKSASVTTFADSHEDQYELLEEIGRGGMGVVYRARQRKLNRVVALKMVLSGVRASTGELARFRAEAEAIAALQSPHILQIFDVGENEHGPFLVLEYAGGGSLSDRIDQAEEPFDANATAKLLEPIANALFHAHERGIIHRDLKPDNIL
ncbi:MAG: serine/threonine protein kinase, partial [Planctomycetales bacterium]|nr:serine/threonine protein kinase [Planctomycetales bacterium]